MQQLRHDLQNEEHVTDGLREENARLNETIQELRNTQQNRINNWVDAPNPVRVQQNEDQANGGAHAADRVEILELEQTIRQLEGRLATVNAANEMLHE